ncbi:hypothetical protein LINPERPRIM_LOCUS20856 [Linum perenne]
MSSNCSTSDTNESDREAPNVRDIGKAVVAQAEQEISDTDAERPLAAIVKKKRLEKVAAREEVETKRVVSLSASNVPQQLAEYSNQTKVPCLKDKSWASMKYYVMPLLMAKVGVDITPFPWKVPSTPAQPDTNSYGLYVARFMEHYIVYRAYTHLGGPQFHLEMGTWGSLRMLPQGRPSQEKEISDGKNGEEIGI